MDDRLMPRECVCDWIGTDECIECYRDKHPIRAEYGWFWDESQGKYTMAKLSKTELSPCEESLSSDNASTD